MINVRRVVALVVGFAMVGGPWPARAQSPAAPAARPDVIQHVIQKGETLHLIATQYYSAPSAFGAIFTRNREKFKDAYERVKKSDPKFDVLLHPFAINMIYPGTVIELPALLESKRGHLYQRMDVPMTSELAQQIADKGRIDLTNLNKISNQIRDGLTNPPKPDPSPQPLPGYTKIVAASPQDATIKREERPEWHKNPSTELHNCAVAICKKYKNICYFECMTAARRFEDGEVLCNKLPKVLPYEIDLENKDRCSLSAP
jgi:hypothetical protein